MADNLTLKQQRAVRALLTTPDVASAAKDAGVSRETVYKWMQVSVFTTALHAAEADALAAVSRRLVRLADTAATTLETAMHDEATPVATRVRAADAVLSRLLQLRELVVLEERVQELEARYAADAGRDGR